MTLLAAAAGCGSAHGDGHVQATQQVVIRPVDAAGAVKQGWNIEPGNSDGPDVDCGSASGGTIASESAVSPDVYYCDPTAASADTCWSVERSTTMVCLEDPWTHNLRQHEATSVVEPVAAPPVPNPVGLELDDGSHCRLRNGGAGDNQAQHPSWVYTYFCAGDALVWTPGGDTEGVDRSGILWRVSVGTAQGPLSEHTVLKALFVGTGA